MSKPLVSVILTHQLDVNQPYLKLALRSLASSKGVALEVWLVSGGKFYPDTEELKLPGFHCLHDPKLDTATAKIEYAMQFLSASSTHILLMSDDVMVAPTCIASMYKAFRGREMIMNPMSNSDSASLYEAHFKMGDQPITHDMKIEDFSEQQYNDFFLADPPSRIDLLVPFQSVSFYCTMVPKSVFVKIGLLDPKLEYRHNDVDFCLRGLQKGIPTVVSFNSFAFHFGTKTLNHFPSSLKDEASKHFYHKWNVN